MNENQIKEEIEKIGYKEFYRYYKEKDILLHQQQQELEKYKNNWEKLKKWLNYSIMFRVALNKMKELEEKNND